MRLRRVGPRKRASRSSPLAAVVYEVPQHREGVQLDGRLYILLRNYFYYCIMTERGRLYCSFFRNSLVFCDFIRKTRIFCRLRPSLSSLICLSNALQSLLWTSKAPKKSNMSNKRWIVQAGQPYVRGTNEVEPSSIQKLPSIPPGRSRSMFQG